MFGAFVGATSAGVANIAVGGSFVGDAAVNAIGFWNGVAAGGASGFTAGFLGTTFSSLRNGVNFGKAILAGLKGGLISGVIGGSIGGVIGGIKANKLNKRFWDGASVNDRIIVDQANPYVQQVNDKNCVAACGESATNGQVTQNQICSNVQSGSSGGIYDGRMVEYIGGITNRRALPMNTNITLTKNYLESHLKQNVRVFLNLNSTPRHEVLLNKIVNREIIKLSGNIINKTLYYVMDPLKGQYIRISFNTIKNSNIWLLF